MEKSLCFIWFEPSTLEWNEDCKEINQQRSGGLQPAYFNFPWYLMRLSPIDQNWKWTYFSISLFASFWALRGNKDALTALSLKEKKKIAHLGLIVFKRQTLYQNRFVVIIDLLLFIFICSPPPPLLPFQGSPFLFSYLRSTEYYKEINLARSHKLHPYVTTEQWSLILLLSETIRYNLMLSDNLGEKSQKLQTFIRKPLRKTPSRCHNSP